MSHLPRILSGPIRIAVLCAALILILSTTGPAAAQQPVRIIFLHHSVGHNLIEEGGVREMFTALGYEFYDHGYNGDGLRLADGTWTGRNFNVPDDNTYPDGMAAIFSQPLHDPPDNTFSYLMQYDVIIFKSCFPTSNISSDAQLQEDMNYYLSIRNRMDQYPDKLFIFVTHPPQVPLSTDAAEARRARQLADWLDSDEFLAGHPNVFTFDLFDLLAGEDNLLRPEYRVSDDDAHPNGIANRAIAPLFVQFVDQAIQSFFSGAPRPTTPSGVQLPAEPSGEEGGEEGETGGEAVAVAGLVDGYETLTAPWDAYTDSADSVIECGADREFAHEGNASLRVHYTAAAPGGWASCGTVFPQPQDWSSTTGMSIWLLADREYQWVTLTVYAGPSDNASPYQVGFETPPESVEDWVQYSFAWDEFTLAGWADQSAPQQIVLTGVTGYSFDFGTDQESIEGIIWVDEFSLLAEGEQPPEPAEEEGEEAAPAEPVEEEEEAVPAEEAEEQPQRRICPGAAMALSLGAAGAVLTLRRRR